MCHARTGASAARTREHLVVTPTALSWCLSDYGPPSPIPPPTNTSHPKQKKNDGFAGFDPVGARYCSSRSRGVSPGSFARILPSTAWSHLRHAMRWHYRRRSSSPVPISSVFRQRFGYDIHFLKGQDISGPSQTNSLPTAAPQLSWLTTRVPSRPCLLRKTIWA